MTTQMTTQMMMTQMNADVLKLEANYKPDIDHVHSFKKNSLECLVFYRHAACLTSDCEACAVRIKYIHCSATAFAESVEEAHEQAMKAICEQITTPPFADKTVPRFEQLARLTEVERASEKKRLEERRLAGEKLRRNHTV